MPRAELLNGEVFYSLAEARVVIEGWRRHYNAIRWELEISWCTDIRRALGLKRLFAFAWVVISVRSLVIMRQRKGVGDQLSSQNCRYMSRLARLLSTASLSCGDRLRGS